jgi:hypothetical protein
VIIQHTESSEIFVEGWMIRFRFPAEEGSFLLVTQAKTVLVPFHSSIQFVQEPFRKGRMDQKLKKRIPPSSNCDLPHYTVLPNTFYALHSLIHA